MKARHIAISCALIGLSLGGCAMAPPEEDPVMVRLNDVERRLEAIERILANGSLVDLTLQVDELQRQVAELRGRVETQEYQAEESAQRQRNLYIDLDERMQRLEGSLERAAAAPRGGTGGDASRELPVPGGSDRENYQAAFELLKEQRYEQAAAAFSEFLATFSDSQLADNAQYWLAETYYVTDRFEEALRQFRIVIDRYPRSRKLPDALLKIGYCNYELENWAAAREALTTVAAEFPDTTAARLADQRLKRMTDEGH